MWQCQKCGRKFKNTNQDHYCEKSSSIDEYIAAQPEEIQPLLQKVRATIHKAAPKATEKISWQMPTFWQDGNLIHFAAFKKHLGIYPGDLSSAPFEERLAAYSKTKGAIHFPYDKPVDYKLIADITRWRVCESAKTRDSGTTDSGKKPPASGKAAGRLTRSVHTIPAYISAALDKSGLWEQYRSRPPYQRNDHIGWITRGKHEETRLKRLTQMLDELRNRDAYMGMAYNAK